MNKYSLSPDDLPPSRISQIDTMLIRNLEKAIGEHFYANCGRIIQTLLSKCHWYVITNSSYFSLTIVCPDIEMYWHIFYAIPDIAKKLKLFSDRAIIRLCPPIDKGTPWEIGVSEISVNKGWFI
jgi:hypothetical protein